MEPSSTRRTVLRSASLGGLGVVAGCLGSAQQSPTDANESDGGTSTPDESNASGQSVSDEEWMRLANVPGDGHAERLFADEVQVHVGTPSVRYAFSPALLSVSSGTTVTWDWHDFAGKNNVVAVDGSFDSGDAVEGHGRKFSHTFESTGTYRYVSEPHADCGMRGFIEVIEQPSTDYPEVAHWLSGVSNYDGTITDATGTKRTTVTVGAEGNGGEFAFDPPAVKVDAGTTVAWKWTGTGGSHDVVFESVDVASELVSEPGEHLTHTFDEPGVYLYACRPHRSVGMKGAIVVV